MYLHAHTDTDMREVTVMVETGQINDRFGVYSNVCCAYEIIIRKGAIFISCPNCQQPATWKLVETDAAA